MSEKKEDWMKELVEAILNRFFINKNKDELKWDKYTYYDMQL